ncbi:Hypothetical_protein [Hexamita inflata]|uniref:Hypothetical_protein n=1 Tax=Hexamita inflata TaxID=28002 RepID=A0AA86PZY8_9EUKA|nr:Hypothetical protein HINF_LOCUS37159 [Hexamita inflata]
MIFMMVIFIPITLTTIKTQTIYYSMPSLKQASNPCSNKLFVDNTAVCYCFRGESVVQHQGQINFQMDIPFFGVIFTGGKQFRNINLNLNVASDPNLQGFAIQHISSQAVFIECQFKVNVNDSIMQSSLVSGKGDLKIFNCQLEFNSTSLETAGLVNTAMALSIKDSSLLVDIDGDQIGVIALYAYGAIEVVRVNLLGAVHSQLSQLFYQVYNNPTITLSNIINNLNVVSGCLNGIFRLTGNMDLNPIEPICETSFSVQPLEPLIVSVMSTTQTASMMNGVSVFASLVLSDTTIIFADGFTTASASSFSLFDSQVTQFYKLKVLSTSNIQISCPGSLFSTNFGLYYNMILIQLQSEHTNSFNYLQTLVNKPTKISNVKLNSIIAGTGSSRFALIQTITSTLDLKFYKVIGSYSSPTYSCLGAVAVSNSDGVNIMYVQINPSLYLIANQSSFLFVNVVNSKIRIARLYLSYGAAGNQQKISTMATSISAAFQYGGLIYLLSTTSTATLTNLTIIQHLDVNVSYVNNSGIIVASTAPSSQFILSKICVQMSCKFSTVKLFGCIGFVNGQVEIKNINLDVQITSQIVGCQMGFIGQIQNQLINCSFTNINVKQYKHPDLLDIGFDSPSVLVGLSLAPTLVKFDRVNIEEVLLVAAGFGGIFVGQCQSGYVSINNSVVKDGAINFGTNCGLIVGNAVSSNVSIQNFKITDSSLMLNDEVSQYGGGVIGNSTNSTISILQGIIQQLELQNINEDMAGVLAICQNSSLSVSNLSMNDSTINGTQNVGIIVSLVQNTTISLLHVNMSNLIITGVQNIGIISLLNHSNSCSLSNIFVNFTIFMAQEIIGTIANINTSQINILQLNVLNTSLQSKGGYGGFVSGLIYNSTLTGTQITVFNSEIKQSNTNDKQYSGICIGALRQSRLSLTNSAFSVSNALDERCFTIFGQTQKGIVKTLTISFTSVTFTSQIFKKCVGTCINNVAFEMPIFCSEDDLNGIDLTKVCQSNIM